MQTESSEQAGLPLPTLCSGSWYMALKRGQAKHFCLSLFQGPTRCKKSRMTHEHAVCTGGASFLDSK